MWEWILLGISALGGFILVLIVGYIILTYNRFIALKNGIDNSFSQISVGMKKRFDMIGQLVETTKSYLKYEKTVFTDVTKLRAMALDTPESVEKADKLASSILGKVSIAVENYPKLKGIETVSHLQRAISDIEDEIARLRYLYNDQVQVYNTMLEQIPANVVGKTLGFKLRKYLKFEEIINKPRSTKVA